MRALRTLSLGLALAALSVCDALAAPATVASLAPTPAMGWSSWYHFGCGIDEALFERTAHKMVSSGMAAVGYRYVNVDDCWMTHKRGASGTLQPNPKEFPAGISGLASSLHGLGLKLGIYLDAGSATCTGFPGSAGHFRQDARTVAAWGADAVKLDFCRARPARAHPLYARFHQAIDETGRAMVLNICEWGYQAPWTWGAKVGSSWRTTGDYFSYGAPRNYWQAVLKVVDLNANLARFARPGGFNDPNALLVGTKVLSVPEERSQLSLWSMMAAPLIAGGELSTISPGTLRVLTNREVIAVDQDPAAVQGRRSADDGVHQEWVRPLGDGSHALLLLNTSSRPIALHADVSQIGPPPAAGYRVRDLWQHWSWRTPGPIFLHVLPHDVRMLRVTT